jgi:hypothetical protein
MLLELPAPLIGEEPIVMLYFWWAHQDSDLGPPHYECAALTS